MYQEKGLYIPFAKIMKETVTVPIICAGRMDNPDLAIKAIKEGACDIVSLGRPLLADPDYVIKLRSGKIKSIRPCISCQEGCMGRIQEYSLLNCAVNPQACRERATALTPALAAKKVMIIGGGIAGCEAARVLALRGHKPFLYEQSDRLGGNLIPGGAPDFKEDDIMLANWYAEQLRDLEVPVELCKKVTKEFILTQEFDALIVATGSIPKVFSLGENEKVLTASQVLLKEKECGERIAIIGGGLVGCETALWLKKQGKQVTIVEAQDKILSLNAPLCHANSEMLERLIPFQEIEVITNAKVDSYCNGVLKMVKDNEVKEIECDNVILAVGYKEKAELYHELEFAVPEIYLLGDARKVSNIMYGIWDAFEVASHI